MSYLHGRNIIVRAATGSGTPTAVALQKSCELTRNCEIREKASQDGQNQEFTPGRRGWQLTVSGLMSNLGNMLTDGTLYTVQISGGGSTLQGTAYCSSVKVVGTVGNLAQQSATFQGTGPLV